MLLMIFAEVAKVLNGSHVLLATSDSLFQTWLTEGEVSTDDWTTFRRAVLAGS